MRALRLGLHGSCSTLPRPVGRLLVDVLDRDRWELLLDEGREATEHLGAESRHILGTEPADPAGQMDRSDEAAFLPPSKRVLVDTEPSRGLSNLKKCHCHAPYLR